MSSSGNATTAPAGAAAPRFDDGMLVYNVDLVILSIIALFILVRIPSALARLSHASEWKNGLMLGNTKFISPHSINYGKEEGGDAGYHGSDESHYKPRGLEKSSISVTSSYPAHVPVCPSFLQGLMSHFKMNVGPGYSFGQFFLLVAWFGILVYPSLYKSTGPFTQPKRYGFIGTAQLPFVFALASKNNIIGFFLGMGYEKLNFLHRGVARFTVLATNIHGLGYIYKWLIAKTFRETISEPHMYYGLIGMICFDILFLFSTQWWRKASYNTFICTHVMAAIAVLPSARFMYFHYAALQPYVYACGVIIAIDKLFSIVKTRFTTAVIRPIPELGLTRIECPNINTGWRAGQHVRIRVVSSGMGFLWGLTEVHPFTIASVSDGPEGLVLMCKKSGRWTKNLYDIASKREGFLEHGVGRNVKLVVEGPYGGPGHLVFASHTAAVFVCGGSGITFATSAIQDLVQKDLDGQSRVRRIELIWIVQDAASPIPLLPLFASIIHQSVFTPVKISVHYTRAVVGKFPVQDDFLPPQLTLTPGRPKMIKAIENAIENTMTLGLSSKDNDPAKGMLVAVCGPVALADDVGRSVRNLNQACKDKVGGVHLYEEVFGW
ncbi:ferric reductase like transmembrane component-domain-containing protein [Mycena floridula]|nr:ferric reductase like transmembrane component-domain-containing protein [Mycena floridula]